MQIIVFLLVQDIKATFSFPTIDIFLFSSLQDFSFINLWESKRQKVFSIRVKVVIVIRNGLAKLLLLELPNVKFLT